jgi:hypothetical protein
MIVVALAAAAAVRSGFTFARQVDTLVDATGTVLIGPNCPRTDFYGTYSCAFEWGTNVTVNYTLALAQTMNASYSLDLDFKVDNLFNLSASCPVCGAHCNATILGITLKFRLPKCPIRAGMDSGVTFVELPAKIPPPFAVLDYLTGTLAITSPGGAVLDRILLTITAVPSRARREITTTAGKASVYFNKHSCTAKPYFTFDANTCTRPPHSGYSYIVRCTPTEHTIERYADRGCTDLTQRWNKSTLGSDFEVVNTTPEGTCYNHGAASLFIFCNGAV